MKSTGLVFAEKPSIGIEPTRLYDRSRYGNHGTYTSITDVQLPSGLWVRSFNGSTGKIDIGNDASLQIIRSMTLVGWVKTTDTTGLFLAKLAVAAPNYKGYGFGLGGDYLRGWFYNATDGYTTGTTVINDDKYHHCAIVYVSTAPLLIAYVDGVDDNAAAGGTLPTSITDSGTSVIIGYDGVVAFGGYYAGILGLPKVYNYSLSAGQIKKIFEAERHWFGV